MSNAPLMPKATAVWLVDNTALSFEQIAALCGLHPLEVQGVADGDVAGGIMGVNPLQNGQLTREEIEKAEADPDYRMKISDPKVHVPPPPSAAARATRRSRAATSGPTPSAGCSATTPSSRTRRSCASSAPPSRPSTGSARTPTGTPNIQPMDPVTLGLCSQIDLDLEVKRAAKEKPTDIGHGGPTLLPASETTRKEPEYEPTEKQRDDLNVDAVFAKLKTIGGKKPDNGSRFL